VPTGGSFALKDIARIEVGALAYSTDSYYRASLRSL